MIRQLFKYGNTYTSVAHTEAGEFVLFQLQQKKKELQILESKTFSTQTDVLEALKGKKHLFLVLNDEQVLFKKIDFVNQDEIKIVKAAFPNINIHNFYYELYRNSTTSFVAIARKKTVDQILSTYLQAGISVVDFSLGNLAIRHLCAIQNYPALQTNNAVIQFEDDIITDIKKESDLKKEYSINDLEVSNDAILPLAGIIAYYSEIPSSTLQNKLQEQYFHRRFFDVGLKTGLGFLLVILLLNFFTFSHYRDQVGNLTGELQMSSSYKNQLNKLQKQVAQKKQLVQSVQSTSNSALSKYFDEIGALLPETNLLDQLSFQPKEGVQKKDKPLLFRENTIIVKGISKNDADFSNWISELEKKDWIQTVSIVAYGEGKRTNTSASFEFIITTND
ncbi:PilN domain-containing protein [Polaribacter vadi]|uniref:PilN domain-containing protein n=1 Tax=Polaribacter vadi TaxID=1774273 RepID=UPI0030EF7173|tara:strand:- start:55996 stop:57168 length:1173 start_codon:yes stop_codon:yes gene_type:complete